MCCLPQCCILPKETDSPDGRKVNGYTHTGGNQYKHTNSLQEQLPNYPPLQKQVLLPSCGVLVGNVSSGRERSKGEGTMKAQTTFSVTKRITQPRHLSLYLHNLTCRESHKIRTQLPQCILAFIFLVLYIQNMTKGSEAF